MSVTAGGNIVVSSTAKANVETIAISAPDDAASSDGGDGGTTSTMDYVKNIARLVLAGAIQKALPASMQGQSEGLIAKLTAGLTTPQYTVKGAVNNDAEKGTVALSRSKANEGTKVIVTVTPKEGYEVDTIRYRFLEPGSDKYSFKNLKTTENHTGVNEYTFDMPASDIAIFVTYKEKTADTGNTTPDSSNNSSDNTGDEEDLGLNDLFNEDEDEDEESDLAPLFDDIEESDKKDDDER
jgi:hypothetical protein